MSDILKKPIDNINLAFNGEFGAVMEEKTRKRIYWIMEKVKGKRVLDIGCSQGITSILLGREGKEVIGIDSLRASINVANESLALEEENVRKNVKFINDNIISMRNNLGTFNTIILGEVLEHFCDWESLLSKALEFGREGCRYIITVPFGINDYFDHKRTYYYSELHEQLINYFDIEESFFMGKWLGVICRKKESENKNESIPINIVKTMEEQFYLLERNLINTNKKLVDLKNKNEKYIELLKAELEEKNTLIKINSILGEFVEELVKNNFIKMNK